MGEPLRRSVLVLSLVIAFAGLPAVLPDLGPDLPVAGLRWLGPAAAEECAGVDPGSGSISVNPAECTP